MGFEPLGLCTAVGFQALANATTAFGNSGLGYQALFNNADGAPSATTGFQPLFDNMNGTTRLSVSVQ